MIKAFSVGPKIFNFAVFFHVVEISFSMRDPTSLPFLASFTCYFVSMYQVYFFVFTIFNVSFFFFPFVFSTKHRCISLFVILEGENTAQDSFTAMYSDKIKNSNPSCAGLSFRKRKRNTITASLYDRLLHTDCACDDGQGVLKNLITGRGPFV